VANVIGSGIARTLVDADGDALGIGDAGAVTADTLRVTIATDDNVSTKLTSIDSDTSDIAGLASTRNTYLNTASSTLTHASSTTGGEYAEGDGGFLATGVRNDDLESLVSVDHDHAPFQVNDIGALYVTGESKHASAVTDYGIGIMAEAKNIDGSALPNTVGEGSATRIAASRAGVQYVSLTDMSGLIAAPNATDDSSQDSTPGMLNVGGEYRSSDTTYTSGDATILQTNINGLLRVDGSDVTQPVSGTVSVNSHAVTNAGTFAVQAGHDITGLASDDNDTVGTSAEKISGADGDVACKRVDIMAHPSNTGEIWVGDSAVTTNGGNGGIRLLAGDFYSMDIDNTGDVYVVASVDGENVCFNYFT